MSRFFFALTGLTLYLCLVCSCRQSAETALTGWEFADSIRSTMSTPEFPELEINILELGAEPGGVVLCTEAIQGAIDSCSVLGGGRVLVPEGIFLSGGLKLKSNVNLHLDPGSVLRFSTDRSCYLPLVHTRFEGMECMNFSPFIYAYEQENIALSGSGTIDGQGASWWGWKGSWGGDIDTGWKPGNKSQKKSVARLRQMVEDQIPADQRIFGEGAMLRPNFIQPYKCRNVLISGVRIIGSPMWVIHPVLSENVIVRGVHIESLGPNNDGCNPECCKNVLIEDCYFNTGDDCIAIKSGRNKDGRLPGIPSENIIVRNCHMAEGHGGVVIGSEMSGGVRNVFAEGCIMDSHNLERAIRIKSNSVRGGLVENVFIRNIEVKQVKEAILKINMFYSTQRGKHIPGVRNITLEKVQGGQSEYAVWIKGYKELPVEGLILRDCEFKQVEQVSYVEGLGSYTLEDVKVNGEVISELLEKEKPWSELMAATLMKDYPEMWTLSNDRDEAPKWRYTSGLTGLAMMKLWEASGNMRYYEYAKAYVDTLVDERGRIATYNMEDFNIDKINPGKMLFQLYDYSGDERYKMAMDTLRTQLQDHPRVSGGGFWHKKRYPHQMWLDGAYMGAPFMAQYGRVFDEPELFDDVTNWLILMEQKTRDTSTGLLYHGWDESRQQEWADPLTGLSPCIWGRAMGWYAMALVDVLEFLPDSYPRRPEIQSIAVRLAASLKEYQDPETGLWYQVVDQGSREGNYLEGSASCMFTYFLLKAVDSRILDPSYQKIAEEAFTGILDHLVSKTPEGEINISPVCAVAGLGGNPYRDGSYEYYINEKQRDNDPKAVGPFIMASLLMEQDGH